MVSNGFTVADPNDPLMMDIVGFDTDAPKAMMMFFFFFVKFLTWRAVTAIVWSTVSITTTT